MKKLFAVLLAVAMVLSMAACVKTPDSTDPSNPDATNPTGNGNTPGLDGDADVHTFHDYNSILPSNWNELTYKDANDSDMISYLNSSFFSFNYEFDEYGEIVPGGFTVEYSAATKLEDVTTEYAEAWGLGDVSTGYAWKITLRDDLKWDNGDPIDAADFVYTMKEQLNPLFQNYRADSYYAGSVNLIGAKDYAKQGQSGWFAADSIYSEYTEEIDGELLFRLGEPTDDCNAEIYIRSWLGAPASYTAEKLAEFMVANYWGSLDNVNVDVLAKMENKTLAEIKADAEMNACWEDILGWWKTDPGEELCFFVAQYTYPEFSWDNVGIFTTGDYELVIVLYQPIALLKDDGSLSYQAAYNLSGLPLVHEATYEACKQAPAEGSTLWTTNYNQSVENTRSWGIYKLDSFQSGKQYVLTKNENWYGWNMEQYEGQYQTDRIVCEMIEEWNTAWVKFQAGELDGIGIDVSIASEYKGSSRAYFTPSSYMGSLQIQSLRAGLEDRETDGVNKTILLYQDFRNAIALGIDRADYTTKCTTASLPGYGLFGDIHYYDVENGGVYRNTDEAKKALCNTYNVNIDDYGGDLDKAVASITGYNIEEARRLIDKAYDEAKAAGDISDTDVVVLTYGTSVDNEATRRHFDYFNNAFQKMCEGTKLEGRISLEFDSSFGDKWADDFRSGAYDLCSGGWQGAAWDPGYLLMAYLDESYRYATGWDTTTQMMTFTMVGVAEDGGDITETMSLMDWWYCLNGYSGCKYDWSENGLPQEKRLQLIAALEEQILESYWSVVLYGSYSASMLSYKIDYISYDYNTFMGYGGLRYMTYNYDDAEWAAAVAAQGNQLNYKN